MGALTRDGLIACEIERSSVRVQQDLEKAMYSQAVRLWIIVLNKRMKASIQRRLSALNVREDEFLSVFTLPESLQQVASFSE